MRVQAMGTPIHTLQRHRYMSPARVAEMLEGEPKTLQNVILLYPLTLLTSNSPQTLDFILLLLSQREFLDLLSIFCRVPKSSGRDGEGG